jgi:hypothetical protein
VFDRRDVVNSEAAHLRVSDKVLRVALLGS